MNEEEIIVILTLAIVRTIGIPMLVFAYIMLEELYHLTREGIGSFKEPFNNGL